jgi:hypothetical protein
MVALKAVRLGSLVAAMVDESAAEKAEKWADQLVQLL